MDRSPDSPRVAIVTGGGQGIGRAIAQRLLQDGLRVAIADLDAEAGAEAAAELATLGEVRALRTDVASEAQVKRLVATTLRGWGRIDALVANAGHADPDSGPLERQTLAAWNRVLATNLTGAWLCAKHAAPALRRSRGAIVTIASTRALQSEPDTEAYAASKGGLVALTHALAISLGPEVRVNCVSPGWIAVDDWKKRRQRKPPRLSREDHAQHPVGRVGRPEDVAALVSWLLSAQAGFVTGQNHLVDGGMTRKMIYAE
jgi:hypothetical protein